MIISLLTRPPALEEHRFSAIKGFGVMGGCIRFHSSEPQDSPKRLLRKPSIFSLGSEVFHDELELLLTNLLVEMEKDVRCPEVRIVLGNFVLQYEMVPECVPGQLGDQSVILMQIHSMVGEYQLRIDLALQFLEVGFYFISDIGEEPVFEFLDDDRPPLGARKESGGAHPGLFFSIFACAEDYPIDNNVLVLADQLEDGPAAANLNVVAMGP
jgi:hypothetical protein